MPAGLTALKHVVVLMMENRSFDHMLGALRADDARIEGLTGTEENLDTKGNPARVKPNAAFQGQLDPDPNHYFNAVDQQIFDGNMAPDRVATMGGFVKSYFGERGDVNHSRLIMNYFKPEKLPVITNLAREYALFNGWFSSIPGPTLCNRAFAHYGTSFGHVGMNIFYPNAIYKSVYQRLETAGKRAKIYYFDVKSSTMEIVNLLQHQPQFFGDFQQFLDDCDNGTLPDYSFIEPNYSDHDSDSGTMLLASDQHPDHDVREGERFIASVYMAIRSKPELWESTAILLVYDEHGGIYDHVPPPACTPDLFVAQPADTRTGKEFRFDRLGVRVPAILISPWVPKGTVVPGAEAAGGRIFEHASIPATVTDHFIGQFDDRSPREKVAETFLDLLTLDQMRTNTIQFGLA
ncbi:MAG TPA: alkaline phosphatase family protein [Vicinamibacterales bacterium]|jgi:phospholipase C|nr:alkaline phosphatase family protein [Vicinamibacterales bacterium]